MNKIMKIPIYISYIGLVISFTLFLIGASTANTSLAMPGVIIFILSGWLLGAKFFLSTLGFFSTVLDNK